MISVVIPVYNRLEQVTTAIQSVFAQSYSDFELIVVDDGSTEDLSSVKFLVESSGHIFIRTKNMGVSHARNTGVRNSSGKYLAFLDSDDEWLPEKLKTQYDYLSNHPEIRICQCEEKWIRNGKFVNPKLIHKKPSGYIFLESLELCLISPSSVMLERVLFEEVGGFNERLVVCEDYDLWLRITKDYDVTTLSEQLVVKYGGHEDQLSYSQVAMDRFRIYSLLLLLKSGKLSLSQQEAVLKTLLKKSSVVANGARKRFEPFRASVYEKVAEICQISV